jgi:hypothetical protein
MKARFFIYGSLFFIALALPVVYKTIDGNLNRQEVAIRKQKENWQYNMIYIEWKLAEKANSVEVFSYHYFKGVEYFELWLDMEQEDYNNLINLSPLLKLLL